MNIIEGIQNQCNRVRALIEIYKTIPTGFIASALMEHAIKEGESSIASGDVIRMIQAYKELTKFQDD